MEPTRPLPSSPPAITLTSRDLVVALAKLICSLPPMPRGVLSCPVDLGGGFQLVFATAASRLPPVTIRSSGCEMVVGASHGRPRWIPESPGFWVSFGRLTGIKAPAHAP